MMTYRSIWTDLFQTTYAQRFVDAGGVRTRFLESGATAAPALILLHGTGGHAEAYCRNMEAHGEYFHTFAIDMIGHGFSDKPEQRYEIADYVEHLRAFLDSQGIARASISGESLGGWVAARFALAYPERVDRLVLNTSGGATFDLEIMKRITTLSLAAVESPEWETVKKRIEFLMADPASVTDDLIAVRLAIYQQHGALENMRRILCLQDPDIRRRNNLTVEEWNAIAAPALVVWTTHDPTAPASVGEHIASMIPGARYTLMENCGHWPQFEDAPHFNRIHLDFLRASA
jgi:2-hydroxy-6-oxonona-2,4-dienedioate hydrolase